MACPSRQTNPGLGNRDRRRRQCRSWCFRFGNCCASAQLCCISTARILCGPAPSMNLLLVGFRLWISRLCSLLSVSAAYQAFSGNITPQLKVRLLQLDLLPFKFQLFAFSGTQHPIYIFESSYSSCPIFAGRLVQNYDLAVCIGVCPVGQEGNLPMNGCFFLFCFAHICCSARSRRVRKRFSFWAGGPKFTRDCQEICF